MKKCIECQKEMYYDIINIDGKCKDCIKLKKPTVSLKDRVHFLAMKTLFNKEEIHG